MTMPLALNMHHFIIISIYLFSAKIAFMFWNWFYFHEYLQVEPYAYNAIIIPLPHLKGIK